MSSPGLSALIDRCSTFPTEYKVPNVLSIEDPSGYFRTIYIAEIVKQMKSTIHREALEKVEKIKTIPSLPGTVGSLKQPEVTVWNTSQDINDWTEIVKGYEDLGLDISLERIITESSDNEELSYFLKVLERERPYHNGRKICLQFNTRLSCGNESCNKEHRKFETTRLKREVKLAIEALEELSIRIILPAITLLGIMEVIRGGVLALQVGVVLLVEEGLQTDPVLVRQ